MTESLIFEKASPDCSGYSLPKLDVPVIDPADHIPARFLRTDLNIPGLAELDMVRHFTRLSRLNHAIDVGFYPLGSCTMKYNPRVNENMARLPGFAHIHPFQPEETVQGALQLIKDLEGMLGEVTGMDAFTLQPAAGAQGELTGIAIIAAYHKKKGVHKKKILIPDSGHGTNPATCTMGGFEVVNLKSNARGGVDLDDLKSKLGPDVAGLMLTNPNTLGMFDENVGEIARLIHSVDGLVYYDGANLNAIMGWSRPGDMGFDIVHVNLHKTFSTPHGGGGPGAGPVGVKKHLEAFLPVPRVEFDGKKYKITAKSRDSIGTVRTLFGNYGVLVRAYTYILLHGAEGLREVSTHAVVNANYLMTAMKKLFDLPFDRHCKHEFVVSGKSYATKHGVKVLDMAKRLMDFGYHAPTVYFPMIVEEAMMMEPTETESRATLDAFAAVMKQITDEAKTDPAKVRNAPHTMPVGRLDEATAARKPDINFYRRPE